MRAKEAACEINSRKRQDNVIYCAIISKTLLGANVFIRWSRWSSVFSACIGYHFMEMKKMIRLNALVLGLLMVLFTSAAFAATDAVPAQEPVVLVSDQETKFMELLNAARTSRGLPPAILCETTTIAARKWSTRMRTTRTFYHGVSGENIARGYATAEGVFRGWRNSPGHWRLLMSPSLTRCGVGQDGNYWTFRRAPQARVTRTVVVNTPSATVCVGNNCGTAATTKSFIRQRVVTGPFGIIRWSR